MVTDSDVIDPAGDADRCRSDKYRPPRKAARCSKNVGALAHNGGISTSGDTEVRAMPLTAWHPARGLLDTTRYQLGAGISWTELRALRPELS
jgi:hypothetical protein